MEFITSSSVVHDCSCVIIGGGIGGILAALTLQKEGLNTVILEKNPFVGGYFAKFEVDDYQFDYGVSNYLGLEPNGWLMRFFQNTGLSHISSSIQQLPIIDHYIFPDFEFSLVADHKKVKADLILLFPKESEAIESFFTILKDLYSAITELQGKNKLTGIRPILMKYMNVKYIPFINELFLNPQLKAILSARVFGSNVNLLTMSAYLGKILFDGMYQVDKDLIKCIAEQYEKLGGRIFFSQEAKDIRLNDSVNNRHKVITSSGLELVTDFIVSACDMKSTFNNLLKNDVSPDTRKTISERQLSLSSLSFFLALDILPPQIEKNQSGRIYFFKSYDVSSLYERKENGEIIIDDGIKVNICSQPKDHSEKNVKALLRIEMDTNYEAFKKLTNKDVLISRCLEIIKEKLYFTDENILFKKVMTPVDFEKLTFASSGAASGWSPNVIYNDLPAIEKNVSKEFYQTGAWDQFGSGILPIFLSTERVCKNIIHRHKISAKSAN